MKTIYNTYVVMESQEQCDRMKQLCIDNGLLENTIDTDFDFDKKYKYFLSASNTFYTGSWDFGNTQITEQEFIELLKTTKC